MTHIENGIIGITMAGEGSRFRKAGFSMPKYEIEVEGRSVFDWSMISLEAFRQAGWQFTFAVRNNWGARAFIEEKCKTLGINIANIVELDGLTDGQATTAKMLVDDIQSDMPFAIYNIDTFVYPGLMSPAGIPKGIDGWIPCFDAPGEGWSFARLGQDGLVCEVREKKRISNHATVGLYWFSSVNLYKQVYAQFYSTSANEEMGERYIAPMYNHMIDKGLNVGISNLAFNKTGMLGTPEQVSAFAGTAAHTVSEIWDK